MYLLKQLNQTNFSLAFRSAFIIDQFKAAAYPSTNNNLEFRLNQRQKFKSKALIPYI
jgi:hypothetical protein